MSPTIGGGNGASLFKRPGSTTNTLIKIGIPAAIIAVVIIFFGGPAGDFLNHALTNLIDFTVEGIAYGLGLLALGALILDPKKRVWYAYRSLTRYITSLLVDIDPIGILKSYKERLQSKLAEMMEAISSLKGQRVKTSKHQQENLVALENEYRLMQQAQKVGDVSALGVHGKQSARLEKRKERYEGEMNRLNLLVAIMDKYYKLCDSTIIDMGNEIKYREEEAEEAKASRKAVGAAMGILKGLPEKELWDEATMKLENDYANAIGEVENFLDVTKDILSASDLQDGADADAAMAKLEVWSKKNSNVNLGGQGQSMSKAAIIQEAAAQISGAPASFNTNQKPTYVVQTVGGDDYLSMGGK